MVLSIQQISGALDSVASNLGKAEEALDRMIEGDDWASPDWYLELAYSQLLILAEALELPLLRRNVATDLKAAKGEGLDKSGITPDGDPYLKWAIPARRYVRAVQSIFAAEPSRTVTKDLESILRSATYSITDRRIFGAPPQNEAEVHLRLEAVLRCVFPDLKHKPSVSKPVKNFEPDTGIPSIQTLIEYKFLARSDAVGQMVDELLADTRGYRSPEWTSFVYVIYETARFRAEHEWRQLLRECGLDARTTVVVLSGEPSATRPSHKKSQRPPPRS